MAALLSSHIGLLLSSTTVLSRSLRLHGCAAVPPDQPYSAARGMTESLVILCVRDACTHALLQGCRPKAASQLFLEAIKWELSGYLDIIMHMSTPPESWPHAMPRQISLKSMLHGDRAVSSRLQLTRKQAERQLALWLTKGFLWGLSL